MNFILTYIFTTLFRYFPIPQKTGLIKIGNPDRNSPVLMTGNFRLTVSIVKRALQNLNVYLLVANSKGINVWCAATGGHFNDHSVISSLKTSGIRELVDHNHVIMPQLAATGIQRSVIKEKTGWKILWGPVDAYDLPEFLDKGSVNKEQRKVHFNLKNRLEMALAWIATFEIFVALIFAWGSYLLITSIILVVITLTIYLLFPLFANWLIHASKGGIGNPRAILLEIILFVVFAPIVYLYGQQQAWSVSVTGWMLFYLAMTIFISFIDLYGTTPIYKSSLHERMEINLDLDLCKGAAFCEIVCPKNCFEIIDRKATIPDKDLCVQCGACIVQCPFDALYFLDSKGRIEPELIRTHKLNLLGGRT